jgi:glutamyl-tRNA synthetase
VIKTRFAPSPTGYLHIGGARTALFSWLYARHHQGKFVLRIEDTDRERSTPEAVEAILDGMRWLQLDWDEGPVFQSERNDHYQHNIDALLAQDQAYHCHCSKQRLEELRETAMREKRKPRYDGHCRELGLSAAIGSVVRFKNPQSGSSGFNDLTRGPIEVDNDELDDFIIRRADGAPTYNFCVVIDDIDMQITHVIRGDDHINNTPRQINLYHALGQPPPQFGHVPMILGEDGSPLSKRHGAVSVIEFRNQGYLREAVLNQLVRLGWSHGDRELFAVADMVQLFDLGDVNRKASVFDMQRLNWLNEHYLRNLPLATISEQLQWHWQQAGIDLADGPAEADVISVQRERVSTLTDLVAQSHAYYQDFDNYHPDHAKKHLRLVAVPVLEALLGLLEQLPDWQEQALHDVVEQVMSQMQLGMGKVAQPLRVALVGSSISPSIDKTLLLVGRERSLQRIRRGIDWIKTHRAVA